MQAHTSYLICAAPRSGSYLLCEALRNTGLAGWPDEYLDTEAVSSSARDALPPSPGYVWHEWRDTPPSWSTAADIRVTLHRVLEKGTTANGVFGAKALWDQFAGFVDKLQEFPEYHNLAAPALMPALFPNLRYIRLIRRDKVRQAISLWRAFQTNQWAWLAGQPAPSNVELSFNYDHIAFMHHLIIEAEAAWQQYFADCGVTPLVIWYEDLVQRYEATALEVLRYLDIPVPTDLTFGPRYLRQQADAHSEEWIRLFRAMSPRDDEFGATERV